MIRDPYRFRSRGLAFVLRYTGLGLVLLFFWGLFSLETVDRILGTEIFGTLIALFALLGVAALMILMSGKLDALSADEVLAADPRPPVLYLRSFADDRAWATPSSLELEMRLGLRDLGPVVALGRPEDRLPIIGVPRLYLGTDANWQEAVRQWMAKASLVVFRAGRSDGLDWEMRMAFETLAPRRLIIIVPGRKAWAAFHAWADTVLPVSLPQQTGTACLVTFGDDWHPRLVHHPRPGQDKEWYQCREVWSPIIQLLQDDAGAA